MMKKIIVRVAVVAILLKFVLLVGCEFETGGSGGFNTALFGWVNFSGVYRAGDGGFLVSAFTAETTGGLTNGAPESVDVGAGPGSSVVEIIQFTVFQAGNVLEIVDNNGARYVGQFGKVETTGGVGGGDINEGAIPASGDTAVAEFTAEGLSASGVSVLMVGTFQGTVSGGSLADRHIIGTWIETGGVTGQIDGRAAPLPIDVLP